jgi:ubiquinone biosynthesis protein UbiJ
VVVSQKTFNDTVEQVNKAFQKLEARIEALEKSKTTPKKTPIDKK